jgi:hypothetical protein
MRAEIIITSDPHESWIGRRRPDFNLRRWRLARLFDDNFSAGRRLLDINRAVAIDHLPFHAAREKRQADGD